MCADAEALDRERVELEVRALLVELRPAEHMHALAVREVEPERVELPAPDRDADTRSVGRVFEREENRRPALVPAELGHLAFDPDGGEASEPLADPAVERGDRVDGSVVVRQRLDLGHGRSVLVGLLQKNLGCRLGRAALSEHLAGDVEVGFTHREPLGERKRIAGLDQDVEAPALHFRALVEEWFEDLGGRLAHGRNSSCCYRRTLLGIVRARAVKAS